MQRTWADDERELLQANYSQEDIALEKQRQYNELVDGGFDQKDIDSYFGAKQPNMTPVQQMLENNYQKYVVNADEDVKDFFDFFDRVVMGKDTKQQEDKVSKSDAFKEGFKESVPVMQYKAAHGESVINHEQLPPEYFDSFDRAAKMAGTIAGDLPYMIAGAAYGGVAGGAAGLAGGFAVAGPAGAAAGLAAGTVIGAGAGANALPAALRSHLVNFYEKGEVTSFGDFWERLTAVMVDTGKEAVYGGASEYVGGKVGAKVAQKGGGYLIQRASQAGSELATMVGMKAAIENEAPSLQDFQDATILIAGLTGSTYTAGKLFKIYKMTGVHPTNVAEEAKKNPALMENLKAANDDLPPEYQSMVTPIQESINMASNVLKTDIKVELYHGTSAKFDDFDYERGGGMVHFAEKEADSMKYAEDIGSGGRKRLNYDEIVLRDYSGKQFYFKQTGEETYRLPSGKEIKTPVGEWVSSDGEVISMKDVEKRTEPMSGDLVASAKNARVIKSSINKSKILDTYPVARWEGRTKARNNPEGLKKIIEIIKPKDKFQQRLVDAAKEELEQTGTNTFGSEFWGLTKNARIEEVNASMKDFVKQLSDAGYEAIRFADDSHSTVAVFDPRYKKQPNMVELTPAEMASKKIRESIGVEEKSEIKQFYEDIKKVKSAEEAYSFGKKIMSGPVANAAREYYSNVMNRYFPIRQVSEKAFERYKLLSGTSGLVRTFVEDHTFDFDTKQRNGESLARIIDDVDDVIGFENYLVARRVVELRNRNITQISNLTTDEANALIKRDASKYEKQAQRFYDFEDRVMDYVKKSGRFSDEDIAVMKQMNRSHISLKKVIDPADTSKGKKTKDPYKRIGSSDLQIRNPLLSTYENVDAAIKLAQINKAKLDFVVDAESKDLVEKVAQPKKMIKISEEEVKKFFEDHGIDADPESFSVFRSAKSFLKENEIEVYNNGKLEVYEIKDKVLAQAVKSFEDDPYMQGIGFNVARAVATAFKFGTTGIPDFIAQNVVVDYITSIVKSADLGELRKNMSPQLFVDAYKYNVAALSSLVKKDAGFYEYLKSGAFGSGWTDAETALLKITEGRYNTKEFDEVHSKTRNVVRTAKDYYEAAQLISEHFVRIKKYQEMKRKGAADNKAGIAAKDETLDFSQRGYNRTLANMSVITAFQNVAIQSVDNFARTVGKDPKKIVMNGTAVLTTGAVALWLVNKDDERIDERPEWEKLTYFHIATDDWQNVSNEYEMAEANALMNLERHSNQVRTLPDGTIQINRGIILKLRKPPVYGEIFATLPTMLLDKFFTDKPQQLDEFSKSFFQNALPTVVPNIAIPMVEQFANKSFFTGNAIIPFTMEKTSPELQYTEYTNPSARALGKMIEGIPIIGNAAKNMNLSSPVVLENYIRQWTGGGGMYLLQIASKVTPQEAYQKYDINKDLKKPASSIADIPFVKRFVSRNPSSGMKSITDFQKYYEKYSQLEADANIERSRWNMENFSAIKQMQLETFAPIKGIADAIRNQTAIIHITYKRPDLNETEKRQLIDATYYQMLGLSQQGLELIRQFEEDNKQFNSEGIEK